jgi:precorrin-4 methylase
MGITNLIHRPAQHSLYAIDKFWFALQNIGKWYLITPVTVIQQEGYSDIEKKRTNYSRIMMDVDKHWIQRQNIQNIQNTQNNIEYNRKSNLFNGNFKNMAELQ